MTRQRRTKIGMNDLAEIARMTGAPEGYVRPADDHKVFTGVHDRTGEKIFSGDTVEVHTGLRRQDGSPMILVGPVCPFNGHWYIITRPAAGSVPGQHTDLNPRQSATYLVR